MGVQAPEIVEDEEDDISIRKFTLPDAPQVVEIPTVPTEGGRPRPENRTGKISGRSTGCS